MGWLTMPRISMGGDATAKAYLDAQFAHQREDDDGVSRGLKVLGSSCPGNRVYYAAVQAMTDGIGREVVAIVCLVRWNPRAKDGYVFGYKSMDETMGPCEVACLEQILDLLSGVVAFLDLAGELHRSCRVHAHQNISSRPKRRLIPERPVQHFLRLSNLLSSIMIWSCPQRKSTYVFCSGSLALAARIARISSTAEETCRWV